MLLAGYGKWGLGAGAAADLVAAGGAGAPAERGGGAVEGGWGGGGEGGGEGERCRRGSRCFGVWWDGVKSGTLGGGGVGYCAYLDRPKVVVGCCFAAKPSLGWRSIYGVTCRVCRVCSVCIVGKGPFLQALLEQQVVVQLCGKPRCGSWAQGAAACRDSVCFVVGCVHACVVA